MEEQQFDELARKLAGPLSRRTAIKIVVTTILGAAFFHPRSSEAQSPIRDNCGTFCRQFPPGPQRGSCLMLALQGKGPCYQCGPKGSNQGLCPRSTGGKCCGEFEGCCGGTCTALNTNENCGFCGNTCPSDRQCGTRGTRTGCLCTRGEPFPCLTGTPNGVCCGEATCVSIPESGGRRECRCGLAKVMCPRGGAGANTLCCDVSPGSTKRDCCPDTGGCVDLKTDPNNCGACGVQCGPNAICVTNALTHTTYCDCPHITWRCGTYTSGKYAGQIRCCNPTSAVCCPPTGITGAGGQVCCDFTVSGCCASVDLSTGTCCASGTTCCRGESSVNCCNSTQNCCLSVDRSASICCPSGTTCCPGDLTVGCCTSGTTCINKACCLNSQACNNNTLCCSGTTPDCCGTVCTNKQTDTNNCGTCGHVCSSGQTCQNGTCIGTCVGDNGTCTQNSDCCSGLCANYGFYKACCPQAQTCGPNCCDAGSVCCSGKCCNPAACQNGTCCALTGQGCLSTSDCCAGNTCINKSCCATANVCTSTDGSAVACCPGGTTCCKGQSAVACCPSGSTCCPSLNPGTVTCCDPIVSGICVATVGSCGCVCGATQDQCGSAGPSCYCFQTTENVMFCGGGDVLFVSGGVPINCTSSKQCQAPGIRRAACVKNPFNLGGTGCADACIYPLCTP